MRITYEDFFLFILKYIKGDSLDTCIDWMRKLREGLVGSQIIDDFVREGNERDSFSWS